MKTDEVESFSSNNVVFRGSGSGIITPDYSGTGLKRSRKLRPEPVDGDITVSDFSDRQRSTESLSSPDQVVPTGRYTQQTISD